MDNKRKLFQPGFSKKAAGKDNEEISGKDGGKVSGKDNERAAGKDNERVPGKISHKLYMAIAAIVLAVFFRFALIGYDFTAICLTGLAVVLVLYELFERRKWNRAKWVLTALIAAGFCCFFISEVPVIRASAGHENPGAAYVIVLGTGVNGTVPSRSLTERLETAEIFLRENPEVTAVLSGGQGPGEDITEAKAMESFLTSCGIAPERLILEDKSSNTKENLINTFALLREMDESFSQKGMNILSSEYHLYRAEGYAKLLGEEVGTIPAKTHLPVLRANYFVREAFGVWKLWIFK